MNGAALQTPALVVAHPGHELRLFGWASRVKPLVYVIADGSGTGGVPRIDSSLRLLKTMGAKRGDMFGSFPDAEIYRAVVEHDVSFFLDLLERLANSFITHRVDFVAGDSMDGTDPVHDLCRALTNAAVAMAERVTGTIPNFEFSLAEWKFAGGEDWNENDCLQFSLDKELFKSKLLAAEGFPGLEDEVREAVGALGIDYFRVERLKRVRGALAIPPLAARPAYEAAGERQVAAGAYRTVIRYESHVLPIMEAIRDCAMARVGS